MPCTRNALVLDETGACLQPFPDRSVARIQFTRNKQSPDPARYQGFSQVLLSGHRKPHVRTSDLLGNGRRLLGNQRLAQRLLHRQGEMARVDQRLKNGLVVPFVQCMGPGRNPSFGPCRIGAPSRCSFFIGQRARVTGFQYQSPDALGHPNRQMHCDSSPKGIPDEVDASIAGLVEDLLNPVHGSIKPRLLCRIRQRRGITRSVTREVKCDHLPAQSRQVGRHGLPIPHEPMKGYKRCVCGLHGLLATHGVIRFGFGTMDWPSGPCSHG